MSQETVIKGKLEKIAAEHVPDIDLKPRIRTFVDPQSGMPKRWRSSRLVIIGLVVIFALAVVGTVYATGSGFGQLFRLDPRVQSINPSTMGQELDFSQTLDGVTVKLTWAFANQDRILVGFDLNAVDGKRFEPYGLKLMDNKGNEYPFEFGYGVTGHSDLMKVTLPAGYGDYIYAFNLPEGIQTGQELALIFQMNAENLITPIQSAPQSKQSDEPYPYSEMLDPLHPNQKVGIFTFNFITIVSP